MQYPTISHSDVRHVEVVSLSSTRVLLILITSTGRIEQRAIELAGHDEAALAALRLFVAGYRPARQPGRRAAISLK